MSLVVVSELVAVQVYAPLRTIAGVSLIGVLWVAVMLMTLPLGNSNITESSGGLDAATAQLRNRSSPGDGLTILVTLTPLTNRRSEEYHSRGNITATLMFIFFVNNCIRGRC